MPNRAVAPAEPLRVVHVLHSHGYGGAESHALILMRGLAALGHEVSYAGPADSWLAEQCARHGIPVDHLRMSGLFDLHSLVRLIRILRRRDAHIVHGHLIRGAHYAGQAARWAGRTRAIATAHATTARTHMRRCARIIAVSAAVQAALREYGYDDSTISLIHNGIPDIPPGPDRAELRRQLGIAPGEFALFNAGRFIRDKGQDLLVEAIRRCPEHVRLYLAGDPNTPFGTEVVQRAGGDPRVRFLGYRADVPLLLRAFDAYIAGSRREALGLSLIEAAAAGLPIVAPAVGGIPEVVADRETGLLVAAGDPAALAAAVDALATDPALTARLGGNARQRYLDHFTDTQMVRRTAAIYQATALRR